MADFTRALNLTLGVEGGYVNDPDDPGKETYYGISRRYHPEWPGWAIWDAAPDKEAVRRELWPLVRGFYKESFWNHFQGDLIRVQAVADELMDCSVNIGINEAVEFLQTSLNVLNRRGTVYPNIAVDGILGMKTLAAISWFSSPGREKDTKALVKIQNTLQGLHYIEEMKGNEAKEKFARGWFSRVSIEEH